MNKATFPVQYDEKFYLNILKEQNVGLNKFAYHKDTIVGALCSRIEESQPTTIIDAAAAAAGTDTTTTTNSTQQRKPATVTYRVYIMTLAVLAAYRGHGIGSELLRTVLDYCQQQQQQQQQQQPGDDGSVKVVVVSEVVLHVQISNHDAIRFYMEKFDFERGALVENYYRRIDPPHCYLLYKKLGLHENNDDKDDDAKRNRDDCEASPPLTLL